MRLSRQRGASENNGTPQKTTKRAGKQPGRGRGNARKPID
jgi:hypothetical protein